MTAEVVRGMGVRASGRPGGQLDDQQDRGTAELGRAAFCAATVRSEEKLTGGAGRCVAGRL